MLTYAELLESLASHPGDACQDFVDGEQGSSRRAGEVLAAAHARGSQLLGLGLRKGDRVGLMIRRPSDFLPLMHGCLLYGLVAVPLYPPPVFGQLERYKDTVAKSLTTAQASVLIADAAVLSRVGSLPVARSLELGALSAGKTVSGPPPAPTDLAFLQFTSGSTGSPRGVCVTHAALMANAHAIMRDGLEATEHDHGVSWLPLYHDMGLIGFGLAPLLTRTKVTFIETARFVRNPAIWLRTLATRRATITFAPNFAYALAARRIDPSGLDLSSVRMWGCGAEPIAPGTLDEFERRFSVSGVRSGQISACYGLAEATLAVTFTPPSAARVVDEVDAEQWEVNGRAQPALSGRTLRFVGCGRSLPGHHVEILGDERRVLAERFEGEIVVRGPSVCDSYFADPEASARVFEASGLRTGDRGYLADGQLFVTGRIKDTIIVNGRNYAPQVIEEAALSVEGVRSAVATNYPGEAGDELAVLVERVAGRDEQIKESVRARVATSVGVAVGLVVCVASGSLPRTTSGKLRRAAAKALLQ